jgi:hypothetical protein
VVFWGGDYGLDSLKWGWNLHTVNGYDAWKVKCVNGKTVQEETIALIGVKYTSLKKTGVLYNAKKLGTTVIRMEKHCMGREISKERAASLSVR